MVSDPCIIFDILAAGVFCCGAPLVLIVPIGLAITLELLDKVKHNDSNLMM
jgi:hypothetical protein